MTKEELFPKSEFPLRGRQIVEWPERSFRAVREIYYQKPPMPFNVFNSDAVDEEPVMGEYEWFSSFDGSLTLAGAARDDQEVCWIEQDGIFHEVSLEEHRRAAEEFFEKFGARFGNIHDEESETVMNEKLDSAPWEMF